MSENNNMSEYKFEYELIDYLQRIGDTKQWIYRSDIKTTDQLWENFRVIVKNLNQDVLDKDLSETEFSQLKKVISNLATPFHAGQFLYGVNGVSQVEIDLDDGRHVFLTIFDQSQIGAGNTVYQVVNQIERLPKINGKQKRIFDTTLLINGLPVIQIEEKRSTNDVNEALNQMHQYIDEKQYSDIFSTVQILVALTPTNAKYMANTTSENFNKDFAFNWQRKDENTFIRDWKEFVNQVLSIPMAHQMVSQFIILDGTKNKQMIKVMRPYQVYATKEVINRIKSIDFNLGKNKIGYIWHTTGSGKTITSFKTAWLASRLPNVDKVVFVVDRISLTKQTYDNYRAFDPDFDINDDDSKGNIQKTNKTRDLMSKLKSKDGGIIVTSVQKLDRLIKNKNFKAPDKNIVFVVDEAHRSTGGESFEKIQEVFTKSAWVGYTGTPMFDETTSGLKTEDIFGELIHAYTIREAIADRNVLGFKVDFETTISEKAMREDYLPQFYKAKYPNWTKEDIEHKINNISEKDIDDTIEPSFYDENMDHIKLVVEDIYTNWRNRSNDGKYNAMLTTNVGGGKASTPMAMMYYNEFQRVNEINKKEGKLVLKVAVTFSRNTSNNDTMLTGNRGLFSAIQQYNKEFNTNFGMDDVSGYTQDIQSRLDKSAEDKNYLDIVIVVNQLLTGFDAPELNTLYVDRTLKDASLIQAYSRTNRVHNMLEKPWGRIINYRWPALNEALMNRALSIYANKNSAQLSIPFDTNDEENEGSILAGTFEEELNNTKETVNKLRDLTYDFNRVPGSETSQQEMLQSLKKYNFEIAKLKQYDFENIPDGITGFDYDNPDDLLKSIGLNSDEEIKLTTVLANELKEIIAKNRGVNISDIELEMIHVKELQVNYDYLSELIAELMNAVEQQRQSDEVVEKINEFTLGLENREFAAKIKKAVISIVKGEFKAKKYPVTANESTDLIEEAYVFNIDREILDFRVKWGITEVIKNVDLRNIFIKYSYNVLDMDDSNEITLLITEGSKQYLSLSKDDEVKNLTRIKYRNSLRKAIYELSDKINRFE